MSDLLGPAAVWPTTRYQCNAGLFTLFSVHLPHQEEVALQGGGTGGLWWGPMEEVKGREQRAGGD